MNRALQLVVLLMAVLALTLHGVADAACKVKADDATGKDADNKIQDAPPKRATNKISFDVVSDEATRRKRATNKIAFDVAGANATADSDYSDEDANESEYNDY